MRLGVGFGVGREPGHAFLAQAVALREVTERLVRGDDHVALAVREAVAIASVERGRALRAHAAALRA